MGRIQIFVHAPERRSTRHRRTEFARGRRSIRRNDRKRLSRFARADRAFDRVAPLRRHRAISRAGLGLPGTVRADSARFFARSPASGAHAGAVVVEPPAIGNTAAHSGCDAERSGSARYHRAENSGWSALLLAGDYWTVSVPVIPGEWIVQ